MSVAKERVAIKLKAHGVSLRLILATLREEGPEHDDSCDELEKAIAHLHAAVSCLSAEIEAEEDPSDDRDPEHPLTPPGWNPRRKH